MIKEKIKKFKEWLIKRLGGYVSRMKDDRYSVFDDKGKVAEHMTLEVASTLVKTLCEKWCNEELTTIIIAREPVREEAWEDDD